MTSRLFALFVLAMLVCPLYAHGAESDDKGPTPPADTATATPSDEQDAAAPSKSAKAVHQLSNNVCEITGTVSKTEAVERSPWSDGTPSTLSNYETDIWVRVTDRRPHYKTATSDSACNRAAKGEILTYKLCSPVTVRNGDRIHAIEGLATGSRHQASCLFDLVVLPPPEKTSSGKKG
jgi:hypothetical protein